VLVKAVVEILVVHEARAVDCRQVAGVEVVRESLAEVLRDAGHTVTTAADGTTALAALEQQDFAIVVTDLRMPGADGLVILRRVRELVAKKVEEKREAKQVGSSLAAELDVHAGGRTFAALARLGDDLRFVLIASRATVHRTEDAEVAVLVTPSAHPKCERCWHYRADVGADAAHPALCARCVSNLYGDGEIRRHA